MYIMRQIAMKMCIMPSKDVMTSKSTSLCQKLRHDVKKYVKFVMMSKSTTRHQKVRHEIKKYVMTSRNTSLC